MPARNLSRFLSRVNEYIGISPRLIFLLSLYVICFVSLMMVCIYAPLIGLVLIGLLATVVAQRARIRQGFARLIQRDKR